MDKIIYNKKKRKDTKIVKVKKMGVMKFKNENFENEVLKSDKPVLVDFFANWCGPCKMMSPIIDEIAEELGEKIKVGKIDVDESKELAAKYNVMSIPTIMIIENGEVKKTFVGLRQKDEIMKEF